MEKEKSTFLFPWVIFTFHGETLPYTFNFERRMHYQYLEGYELYRFHELLSYICFWIAECKILLVTCLPTYNMEYGICNTCVTDLQLHLHFFWFLLWQLGGIRDPRRCTVMKAIQSVQYMEFPCMLSQLEHLLWSVLSPSHWLKHCLTLVESVPLCWLNMSLLQAFTWWFFF